MATTTRPRNTHFNCIEPGFRDRCTTLFHTWNLIAIVDGIPAEILKVRAYQSAGSHTVRLCLWIDEATEGFSGHSAWLAATGMDSSFGHDRCAAALEKALAKLGICTLQLIGGQDQFMGAFSEIADMAGFHGPYLLIQD